MRARPPAIMASAIGYPSALLAYEEVTCPINSMGGRWPALAATCAPSSSTVPALRVRSPTSCLRCADFIEARSNERLPMKSALFLPMTHDDVTLLRAQHVHGLGAVFHHAMRLSGVVYRLPYRTTVICGHVHFEAQLAGKADPEQQHGNAADRAASHGHVRHGGRADVDSFHQRLEDAARLGSLHGDHGPLLGGRRQPYFELGPFGLAVVFHHREHARRTAGGGRHMEPIGGRSRHHAVVVDEAVVAAEDSIACAPHAQIRPIV